MLSVFAGLRPLVQANGGEDTKKISREHAVLVSASGLVTIVGGKWTTYRKMAQDAVDDAVAVGGLEPRACPTEELQLHGFLERSDPDFPEEASLQAYGAFHRELEQLGRQQPEWGAALHPRLPYRGVHAVWAARHEMARSVEDVLARRTRSLLLDARASIEAAPAVARLLGAELARDASWCEEQVRRYRELARSYLLDDA